jgi:3-hydroxybutyryl-CoA dehydrogenase
MLKKFVRFGFIQVFRAMQIAVIGNDLHRKALACTPGNLQWLKEPDQLQGFDAVIDLLFDESTSRIALLKNSGAELVIVNSVEYTLADIDTGFIRVNAWTGFLNKKTVEAAVLNEQLKPKAEALFAGFERTLEWLPDQPGFVTARVIAMIINEAYYALEDDVSSKEDINTAMKTGTNYPFGPFEWAAEIGLDKIASLLTRLSKSNPRYQPSKLLLQEAVPGYQD